MTPEWQNVPLERLIEPDRGISYGIVQPGSRVADGVPIIRVKDVRNGRIATNDPLRVAPEVESAYSRTRLRGGELLLTLVGTVGEAAVVPESLAGWNTARAIAVIPVQREVGAYWVSLALRATGVRQIIESRLNTTVQATLNLRDVTQLPIVLPPENERTAISGVLGTLDDKIDALRRVNQGLEEVASTIVETAASQLRTCALGERIEVLETGRRPKGGAGSSADGVPSIGAESVLGAGNFDFAKTKYVPRTFFEQMSAGHLEDGDILLYKDGAGIGATALIGEGFPFEEACINEHVFRLRTCEPYSQELTYLLLRRPSTIEEMKQRATGAAIPGLNRTAVGELSIPMLDSDLATKLTARVAPLLRAVLVNARQARRLELIRDRLLPRLVSGQIRVSASYDPPDFVSTGSEAAAAPA
jgi:type I restriction enzyme S subunit